MCDVCADILEILESRDVRNSDKSGSLLTKKEITSIIHYTQLWPQQRQCMCCYADIKNFSRFNNVIQLMLAQAIQFIETLTREAKVATSSSTTTEEDEVDVTSLETSKSSSRELMEGMSTDDSMDGRRNSSPDSKETWSLEEKDRLFQFVIKVFSPGFPLYLAFKHRVPTTLEELAKHDTSVLNTYCELNDPDVPLLLLRNVCYFCDSNGFKALAQCFRDSQPDTLPLSVAQTLVSICANVRMWMNYRAAARFMNMIRRQIIGYMCHFTEKDLRTTMARTMTELVWQALKDSRDLTNQTCLVTFDKEGLDLAFKYFTCSMLTLRLAGIAQINTQINMYTELAQGEGMAEVESVGSQLSDWLIDNKIIEQIFGPNLHVEIIKQSQVILNFLALECRFTNDHVDVIWGASQLKHCGKQVLDILSMMVKNMDLIPAQHLHGLMQQLEPSAHTEQTLMLASALTKLLWMNNLTPQNHQTLTLVARHHGNQAQVFAVAAQQMSEDADLVNGVNFLMTGELLKQAQFGSSRSDSDDEEEEEEDDDEDADASGNELEMGEVKQLRHPLQHHHHFSSHHLQHHRIPHLMLAASSPLKECWNESLHHAKLPGHSQGHMVRNRRFKSSSTDGQRSEPKSDDEDDDDNQSEEEERVSRNVGKHRKSNHKKFPLKMVGHQGNRDQSFKRLKQSTHRKQRQEEDDDEDDDNENDGSKNRIIKMSESRKMDNSKSSPFKKKFRLLHDGLSAGRVLFKPKLPHNQVKYRLTDRQEVSDDEEGKKESDDENNDAGDLSDSEVDMSSIACKENKSSDEDDGAEDETGVAENDEEKEKSPSASPSSSSSGSVSTCDEERKNKRRFSNKICLTNSPQDFQGSISIGRPIAGKSRRALMMAMRLKNQKKNFVNLMAKTDSSDKIGRGVKDKHPSLKRAEIAGKSLNEGSLATRDVDNSLHDFGDSETIHKDLPEAQKHEHKMSYLQQHLNQQSEKPASDSPSQVHIYKQQEEKPNTNDENHLQMTQPVVDSSVCKQQRPPVDSASEEHLMVLPTCRDDDVAMVTDAMLVEAYSVKDGGRMMQFDDEGNKALTAEDLEACLDSSGNEPGVILLKSNQSIPGNLVEDILSPEGTSNSSRFTNKSEKNMSDFEGEDAISDEELANINAHSPFVGLHPLQPQLATIAPFYHHPHHHHHHHLHAHTHLQEVFHETQVSLGPRDVGEAKLNELCQPQNTIIWDLLQDHNIDKLQEGLASEAEKILSSLICLTSDKKMKSKFIEACISNLAQNKSVVISLRLLSKLLNSFNQYRSGPNTHYMTLWADSELSMLKHFFNNLLHYTKAFKQDMKMHNIFSHKEEVQSRLQFLTCVFSLNGSPEGFRLNMDQMDILWDCLAYDPQCSDDCLQWFYNQTKNKDYHALKMDTLRHIFVEKMPLLKAEETSMIGLNLFTQLCHLAHSASGDSSHSDDQNYGIDQLWEIALRARNTDVSLNAISVLNHHYISIGGGALDKEESFVQKCMKSLMVASGDLYQNAESSLLVIQRALILLTNHLESFRKQHAYHLRLCQLNNQMVQSHYNVGKNLPPSLSYPHKIRIIFQTAGSNARTAIEMSPNDLVAELRAEINHWWETMHNKNNAQQHPDKCETSAGKGGSANPGIVYGGVRLITQGQELSPQVDDKTLAEMQFKDHQLVFVSQSGGRSKKVDSQQLMNSLYKLPMILLTEEPHFTCLFNLLHQLSSFSPSNFDGDLQEHCSLQTKARVLSRKVWSLLMLLPTNKKMFEAFFGLSDESAHQTTKTAWRELLEPTNAHKLMYSLLIVESLSRPNKSKSKSYKVSGANVQSNEDALESCPEKQWKNKFVACGGFQHLLSILLSGVLQDQDGSKQDEWQNDCLACLLRLINLFAISNCDLETYHSELFDMLESPMKKMSKRRPSEKMVVPCINEHLSSQMDVEALTKVLMMTMFNAAMPCREFDRLPVTSWGHVDVVRCSMSLLVSLAFSFPSVLSMFATSENFPSWLKRMTLEALEPSIRQESCQGLYRLCLGKTSDGQTGYKYLILTFNNLLPCLADACSLKPAKKSTPGLSASFGKSHDDKEPYGPGCRDYLWLMCQLVDGIKKEDAEKSWNQAEVAGGSRTDGDDSKACIEKTQLADLSEVGRAVAGRIVGRGFFEKRHNTVDDDGLVGLLKFCQCLLKHNPPFKTSTEGQTFLIDIFQCLFALPSPTARFLPKCKSQSSRNAAFDLLIEMVKGNVESYIILHSLLMKQNHKDSHMPYSWDTWPHDEERSKCGYVGLTNLGATCYMATCMQHLFMIPEARRVILDAKCLDSTNHAGILIELKKMFAYLLESERKAYNPYSFCKVYTMDHQPLNTGEQKDMTEFFTDLITKLEEMGPDMKSMVKSLFGGVLTNNVVSLDCPHVSRTKEEFYTVRCQVADMKNLNESLDEVTVKDMLEGDNMYTCSKCQKKVRAEKRACFCKLPSILCFNTMRYTFNMITMMKEKVNTHFSFPLKLDMSPYMETNLISRQCSNNEDRERLSTSELDDASQTSESPTNQDENAEEQSNETGFEYELIGVTVHTGTADAGHYYSFIRDRTNKTDIGQDRWYLFNDAEVKPFDPAQLASECFGGETTSKTYDSVTDKFMDFSFEKTHSAYMLFYERINNTNPCSSANQLKVKDPLVTPPMPPPFRASSRSDDIGTATPFGSTDEDDQLRSKYELPPDLAEWIWQDNTQFLQDKSIFEHSYFSFMMQMCNSVPATLPRNNPNIQIPLLATKLSTSFILETLIHAKEKPTMLQFIENTTKFFNSDRRCCEWFLDTMTEDDWWPQQILIRCPNQTVRQMFQRLVIHVINQLKPVHNKSEDEPDVSSSAVDDSCVNRFIRKMLAIIEQDSRLHCRYLAEYFGFLLEFAKIRDNECRFLNQINTITILVGFFMSHKQQGDYTTSNELSDDDDERDFEDIINLSDDKYCPQALEKMISLVALLVEKSRVDHKNLHLSDKDTHALLGGRGLPFLYHQIRDAINLRQTCNLIFSLSRFNERLASNIIQMILHSLTRTGTETQPFFKLLSMLVEFVGGPPGMPLFLQHILVKFWEVAEYCPQPALEWLSTQVMRNKMAMTWVLQTMDAWVEMYLMSYSNVRVRNCAAHLLVALVPSNTFRQTFKTNRSMLTSHKEPITMSEEAVEVVHEVYGHLLKLLCKARQYVDGQGHGTSKLVPYFSVLNYCLISKTEKLMFSRYFNDLWLLFQPKLSEPQIAVNHNKQAMLIFWYHVCLDCPENIKLIVSNPSISKNIAFNYILADHEDQEVIMTNRTTLPAYYGILRMCCMQSPAFTRYLAAHQNIQWAFRNITTHPTQYTAAVDELYWLMRLMVAITPGMSEEDVKAVVQFRRNTIQLYLQILDARSQWQTLVAVFRILLDRHEERIFVLQNNGIILMYEAFTTLHLMHYEATACHVAEDINHLLGIISQMLASARKHLPEKKGSDVKPHLTAWKDRGEFMKKLLSLLNFYTPPEMRQATFACLREMILTYQFEWIQTIVPMLVQAHASFQATNEPVSMGPYFPRPGQKAGLAKSNLRTPRPQFQMFLHASQVESKKGVDSSYDAALYEAFDPYHHLVDLLLRVAVNHQNLPDAIVRLSAMVAYEGAPLHLPYFAKLWYEIYQTESVDRKWVDVLCSCPSFIEYIDSVLTNERASLNNLHIYQFFCNFFPKVHTKVLTNQNPDLMASIISSIESSSLPSENDPMTPREMERMWTNINGDLKALQITLSVQESKKVPPSLIECFKCFQQQFFRALQFYQATSGHQPSTSTRQVPASKLPAVSTTRTAVDDHTSSSSTPKLLQNIITGKGPSKRRRIGSKGELEELFMSPNSNKSSNLDSDTSSRTKKSGNKRGHEDDDEDDSEAEEYSYVTNSVLDTSVEENKGTLSSLRDDQPSTSKSLPASSPPSSNRESTSLDQGVVIKDDDDMDVSDDNDDDDKRSEDDSSGDKKSFLHADKPQTSYSLATKDKPSLVDSVVKNVDAVFRLILDKVNGKDQ